METESQTAVLELLMNGAGGVVLPVLLGGGYKLWQKIVAMEQRFLAIAAKQEKAEKTWKRRTKMRNRERISHNRQMAWIATSLGQLKQAGRDEQPASNAWTTTEIPVDFVNTIPEEDYDDEDDD